MSYFELILQNPIENAPTLGFILIGFFTTVRMVLKLFSAQQNLQAGNQAIITQDNTLQSKLLDEMTARRVSDEQFKRSDEQLKSRLMSLLDETANRIDMTTLRIDGTTLATSADVKAIGTKLDQFLAQLKVMGVVQ